jgi:nitroreductase
VTDGDRAGLHPLLASRWSPRQFDPSHVLAPGDLHLLLEAARWAPSKFNGQPTRWIVSLRGEPLNSRLLEVLSRGNRNWVPRAAALLFALIPTPPREDPERVYADNRHDAGQAVAHLSFQAAHLGLHAHQMAGFDHDGVRTAAGLGPDLEPVVGIAVGRWGGPDLPEGLAAKEARPRTRLPLDELVVASDELPPR